MVHVYFSQEKFVATKVTYVLLASTALLSMMMVPRFFAAMSEDRKWWAPVLLEIIVAHAAIYLQFAIDAVTWNEKLRKWQTELEFQKRYATDLETSETALREKLSSFLI